MKKYFKKIDVALYFILLFCALGLARNLFYLFSFKFDYSNALTKVFIAMSSLYAGQIILILMKERKAWLISALQVIFCVYVYGDYTFIQFGGAVKAIAGKMFPAMGLDWLLFLETACASLMFSLELLKTYFVYALLPFPLKRRKRQKQRQSA
jgi:hypothetical protein